MSKKPDEINPICGERLKKLITLSGLSQKQFAKDVVHLSPEHFSLIVNGKRNLTPENAKVIIREFPQDIRYEWLMGIDDFMSENERYDSLLSKEERERQIIEELIKLHGYKLEPYTDAESESERIKITPPQGVYKTDNSIDYLYHENRRSYGSSFDKRIIEDFNNYIEKSLAFLFRDIESKSGDNVYGGL